MTVRMWISGKQVPDELAQATIAQRYNVSVDSLFPRREEAQAI
nr:MAG TPA: helix-turn-helix domain protein [Bacteriophage sp.]